MKKVMAYALLVLICGCAATKPEGHKSLSSVDDERLQQCFTAAYATWAGVLGVKEGRPIYQANTFINKQVADTVDRDEAKGIVEKFANGGFSNSERAGASMFVTCAKRRAPEREVSEQSAAECFSSQMAIIEFYSSRDEGENYEMAAEKYVSKRGISDADVIKRVQKRAYDFYMVSAGGESAYNMTHYLLCIDRPEILGLPTE